MTNCFIDTFNEYFDIVPAISDDLKNEVYKLRYQIYCLETGFEDPDNHPDGLEIDEFDSHSVHYLIRHRKLGVYMATTRLILPCPNDIEKLYPIEMHTQIDNVEALKHVSREYLAEASRFCISKEFRRRKNEIHTVPGINEETEKVFTEDEQRIFPHLTLALFTCLIKMSRENNILDWYAVMEPALIRIFKTIGMDFIGIGPITDYHGMRRPCTIRVDDLLAGVKEKNLDYWDALTNKGQFWSV